MEKRKEKKRKNGFNVDFLGYLSLKCTLKIENIISPPKKQVDKFEKFNIIFENLNILHAFIIALYNLEIANVCIGKIPYNSSMMMNTEGVACFFVKEREKKQQT